MRIQHNITAMNAYRNYTNNASAVAKNLEKLSSGYKINRAGDDAAGLAISEKMRAQITGLQTAQKNAKDGISLVKTGEGALTEVHDMLNRMYELAEQSANGTYDDTVDRANLQKEITSLSDEIDRIADSVNFNGINLLDGSLGGVAKIKSEVGKAAGADVVSYTYDAANADALSLAGTDGIAIALKAGHGASTGAVKIDTTSVAAAAATVTGATSAGTFNLDMSDSACKTDVLNGLKLVFTKGAGATGYSFDGTTITVDLGSTAGNMNATAAIEAAVGAALDTKQGGSAETLSAEQIAALKKIGYTGSGVTATTAPTVLTGGGTFAFGDDGKVESTKIEVSIGATKVAEKTFKDSEITNGGTLTIDGAKAAVTLKLGANTTTLKGADINTGNTFGNYTITAGEAAVGAKTELDFTGKTGKDVIGATLKLGDITYEFVKTGEAAKTQGATKVEVAENADATAIVTALEAALDGAGNNDKVTAGTETYSLATNAGKLTLTNDAGGADSKAASFTQGGKGLKLQIGDTADDFNKLTVSIKDMHVEAMGIGTIDIGKQGGGSEAMAKIKSAINYVSDVRGDLGATQNRLEHTINNLSVMQENIQDAESSIRDVDVAEEMMAYTKNNILVQSAQAMLAQANQLPQGVLQLLQ